jgi:hypothetical protein
VATALLAVEPVRALRALVQDLADEGKTKIEIRELLEKVLVQMRTHSDVSEAHEDAVLDVPDALTGWCHPSAELLPDQPNPSLKKN